MLVYLGVITVLLITSEVKNICEITNEQRNDYYKDLNNNKIYLNSYCNNSVVCVVKCCDKSEVIGNEGTCKEPSHGINNKINDISVYRWDEITREPKKRRKYINKDLVLLRNEKFPNWSTNNHFINEFYILEDGSIQLKVDNQRGDLWVEASPLDFCIDYRESAADYDDTNRLKLSVKLVKECIKDKDENLEMIAGGMAISFFCLGVLMYRLSVRMIRMFSTVLMAYTVTLIVSYICTAVLDITMRIGIIGTTGCRIIGPFLYFSILSEFFWPTVISFEAWWKIRSFRKYTIKVDQAPANCLRYSLYCWGIPFLMTIIAVVVDILKLDTILPIERPPFDSCFANGMYEVDCKISSGYCIEKLMTLYMHMPIAILMATNCLIFLMNIYNIWLLQRTLRKTLDIKFIMISKKRFLIYLKMAAIVGMTCALEFIFHVPTVIYVTMHIYNLLVGGTLFIMFVYEKCTYKLPTESYNFNERLKATNSNLSGQLTIRSTVNSTFFKDQTSQEIYEVNTMSTKIAMVNGISLNRTSNLNLTLEKS